MTDPTPSTPPPPSAEHAPASARRSGSALNTPFTLPAVDMIRTGLIRAAAVSALGAVVAWILRGTPGALAGGIAFAAVGSAVVAGTLLIQPWTPRLGTQWPMLLLGCQGVMFVAVAAVGLLLYSATRPDPLSFGLVVVVGFTAALIGMVGVYSRVAAAHEASFKG